MQKALKTILVIDDDIDFTCLVSELLMREGIAVIAAGSGRDANKQLDMRSFDLIVVDGKLPDTDGIHWIENYRKSDVHTPIIVASSLWYGREDGARLSHDLNVAQLLHKPLVPSLFSMCVSQLLSPDNAIPEPTVPKKKLQSQLDIMRGEYLPKLLERGRQLRLDLYSCWEEGLESPAVGEAIMTSHRIRGTAGSFGFPAAGLAAGEVEDALLAWKRKGVQPDWMAMIKACDRILKAGEQVVKHWDTPKRSNVFRNDKILVIDDDEEFLKIISEVMGPYGFQIHTSTDSVNWLNILEEVKPDLLLLDVSMPNNDGFEICRSLRNHPAWQWLPVLFLTIHNDIETRINAFRAQADDFICKPIVGEELAARIEVRLERLYLQQEHQSTIEALEQSHENLYAILQQLQHGVMIVDSKNKVRFLSDVCRQILGFSHTATKGRLWEELISIGPDDLEQLKQLTQEEDSKRTSMQLALVSNGKHLWVEVTVRNDPRHDGGLIFYFKDISELFDLRERVEGRYNRQIIGKSEPMMRMFKSIRQLSRGDWTVLVEGETGSGKELVARAIHETSPRKREPFIAVNCAGLSESLLASQLFGHRRGSFSGAIADQVGLFRAADKGTLFLDEIGDIPQSVQTSLLRVLQEGEITPLGEVHPRKVDVRIIAASHRNLHREVSRGNFREDLFYRLQVGRVKIPPLRDRREDIPMLVAHFMAKMRREGMEIREVCTKAMAQLLKHSWPGNVRELENAISFASIHASEHVITRDDLPPEILDPENLVPVPVLVGAMSGAVNATVAEEQPRAVPLAIGQYEPRQERRRIMRALIDAGGNRSQAARILGMGRATLYRRMNDLNIEAGDNLP